MFTKEKLYTPQGGFVTEVSLPPFNEKPEVLIWGARVFMHVDGLYLEPDMPAMGIQCVDANECYVEAWAYYVPPTVEEMPKRDLLFTNYADGESTPMEDRVYVPPELTLLQSCGCSLAPGYHFAACDIAKTALLNGTARQVYMREIPEAPVDLTKQIKELQALAETLPELSAIVTHPDVDPERIKELEALAKEHPEGAVVPAPLLYHEFKVGEGFNCGWCFGGYTFTAETLSIPERGLAFCCEAHKTLYMDQFPTTG